MLVEESPVVGNGAWSTPDICADGGESGTATEAYNACKSSSSKDPDMIMQNNVQETFAKEGLNYTMEGDTGNTLNSHRLIAFAGRQGPDVQDRIVEQLFKAYFTEVCPRQQPVMNCIYWRVCVIEGATFILPCHATLACLCEATSLPINNTF